MVEDHNVHSLHLRARSGAARSNASQAAALCQWKKLGLTSKNLFQACDLTFNVKEWFFTSLMQIRKPN